MYTTIFLLSKAPPEGFRKRPLSALRATSPNSFALGTDRLFFPMRPQNALALLGSCHDNRQGWRYASEPQDVSESQVTEGVFSSYPSNSSNTSYSSNNSHRLRQQSYHNEVSHSEAYHIQLYGLAETVL